MNDKLYNYDWHERTFENMTPEILKVETINQFFIKWVSTLRFEGKA